MTVNSNRLLKPTTACMNENYNYHFFKGAGIDEFQVTHTFLSNVCTLHKNVPKSWTTSNVPSTNFSETDKKVRLNVTI